MGDEYPAGGYILLLVGGILEILGGISILAAGLVFTMVSSAGPGPGPEPFPLFFGLTCVIAQAIWVLGMGVASIIAAKRVRTGNPEAVHSGAVLGIVASILGLNIISLIGAILAYVWKPPATNYVPPPPPPM